MRLLFALGFFPACQYLY